MKEAILYKKLGDSRVQCDVCEHGCTIQNGQRGICAVRENRSGKLFALNYRKAISEAIDPIEKKPFFHFLPGSCALSFATLGCNFRCQNCQNWQISQGSKAGQDIVGEDIAPEEFVRHALAQHCASIAYTYTEPTIFLEYALDTMMLAREAGLKNIWVSNGYQSQSTIKEILPYLDAINIDLKFFDEQSYLKNCGAHLQPILDNIVRFKKAGVWVEITTLVIPGHSDSEEMFEKIAFFVKEKVGADTPWHLSRFSPEISYQMTDGQMTQLSTLERAAEIGTAHDLEYVYLGNIPGHRRENTYCPECQELVIERRGYQIKRHDQNGKCPKCTYHLALII